MDFEAELLELDAAVDEEQLRYFAKAIAERVESAGFDIEVLSPAPDNLAVAGGG